ncbi:hypothetical protein ACH5RR_003445 [Cinchona calisaya]|uniref:Uncharacterized protein n=1 Tax=Cinchona calisaya TaxID=153742 RepID=A0ABD3AUX4_9GENT
MPTMMYAIDNLRILIIFPAFAPEQRISGRPLGFSWASLEAILSGISIWKLHVVWMRLLEISTIGKLKEEDSVLEVPSSFSKLTKNSVFLKDKKEVGNRKGKGSIDEDRDGDGSRGRERRDKSRGRGLRLWRKMWWWLVAIGWEKGDRRLWRKMWRWLIAIGREVGDCGEKRGDDW